MTIHSNSLSSLALNQGCEQGQRSEARICMTGRRDQYAHAAVRLFHDCINIADMGLI